MKTPPSLKSGDKIGIVSTARKITSEELSFSEKVIKDWGFKPVPGKTIDTRYHQFAGTDAARIADLQNMLDDPEIKAILCARGGYGTVRTVDHLDFSKFVEHPKWIVGYSDVTVLHAHIHANFSIETIHASMPVNFQKNTTAALESLKNVLLGKSLSYEVEPHPFNKGGSCKGKLIGGNLSILYSIAGTKSDIQTAGKILFLEDLDEYLYHIDRMMMQLKRSGKLEKLSGMIIGGFTDMNDNETPYGKDALEIIKEHADEFSFPVVFNFPAGHLADNRALIMGREIALEIDNKKCSLEFKI